MYTDPTGHSIDRGDTGKNVKSLQTTLKELGYYTGKVDGIFGSKTEAAVKAYQKENDLKVDGIVGKKTSAALYDSLVEATTASASSSKNSTNNNAQTSNTESSYNKNKNATNNKNSNNVVDNQNKTVQESAFVISPNGTIAVTGGVVFGEQAVGAVVSNPYVTATVFLTAVFTYFWPAEQVNVGEDELIEQYKKAQNAEGAGNSTVNSIPNKYPWNELPTTGEHKFEPPVDKAGNPVLKKGPNGGAMDKYGNEWIIDKQGSKVGNPHWDVNHKNGSHTNVNPESGNNPGEVNHGKDNFK